MVCSRQLYSEALGNDGNPAQWEIREINDIMNNCSDWIAFSNPRHFPEPYRRQKGWEKPDNRGQDFQPITKEQMHDYLTETKMLDYSNENIKQLIRERKWSDS